jgi:hypothetical protein
VTQLHPLLLFLHVLSISAWLGAALWVPRDVKRTLASIGADVDALAARVQAALRLDAFAGVAAIATGMLLVWEEAVARPRLGIVLGMLLAFARLGLLVALGRAWQEVLGRVRAGEAAAPADRAARRLPMFSGMAHTAWLAALACMVFPF